MEGPPPPRAKDMTRIMHQQLPLSPRAFLQRFLSDDVDFFQRFHASRGDKHIHLSRWGMLAMGCVRELQFVSPLKYRIGPPEARCHQTQRYCLYEGEHLVFESSQVIPEIPYGDHVRDRGWVGVTRGVDKLLLFFFVCFCHRSYDEHHAYWRHCKCMIVIIITPLPP